MPNFAMTFFFQSIAGAQYGWSETYYWGGDAEGLDTTNTEAAAMSTLRQAILVDSCEVMAWRISNVDVTGDSVLGAPTVGTGTIDSTMHLPVDPWSCLLLRMEAGSTKRGRKFLHGVPEDFFTAAQLYDGANALNAAVLAFRNHLKNTSYKLQVRTAGVRSYPAITNTTPQRKAFHQIGRPSGGYRGRHSAG